MRRPETNAVANAETNAPTDDDQMRCPRCGTKLVVLYWMMQVPDGYICNRCGVWLGDDLGPLARIF